MKTYLYLVTLQKYFDTLLCLRPSQNKLWYFSLVSDLQQKRVYIISSHNEGSVPKQNNRGVEGCTTPLGRALFGPVFWGVQLIV